MNKGQAITIWGIIVAIISLLGLEAWSLCNNHPNDTISEIIHYQSKRWLFIPFLFGFLMGHWFWPLLLKEKNKCLTLY